MSRILEIIRFALYILFIIIGQEVLDIVWWKVSILMFITLPIVLVSCLQGNLEKDEDSISE